MGKINKGITTEIQPRKITPKSDIKFEQACLSDAKYLSDNIKAINNENCQLKLKLLGLIDDYKLLKQYVLNNNDFNHKKRSFNQLEQSFDVDLAEDYELKNLDQSFKDIKLNTSTTRANLTHFLEEDELIDEEIDDFIDDLDSPLLSRTSSPSEDEDNSLMSTLTRSTTVSTNNSFMDKMELHSNQSRFFDLPKFVDNNNIHNINNNSNNSNNKFKNLSKNFDVLQQDQYNLINDFLEEKLIDNDVNYYQALSFQND